TAFYSVNNFFVTSPGGSSLGVWQTPDAYTALVPSCGSNGCLALNSGYSFCTDMACNFQDQFVTTVSGQTSFLQYYYYELLEQQPYQNVIGGGSPPAMNIAYQVPPTCTANPCNQNGLSDTTQGFSANLPVSPSTADIFPVWGSTAT